MEVIKSKVVNSTLILGDAQGLKTDNKGIVVTMVHPDNSSIGESESSDDFKNGNEITGVWMKYKGFVWTMWSSLFWTMTALIVTYLKDYHPINLALWRYQGAFLPAIPVLLMHQLTDSKRRREKVGSVEKLEDGQSEMTIKEGPNYSKLKMSAVLLARSFLTCNALVLHFYSLKFLPLGDALVITSSTPIFAYFLAHYFLGEACGIFPMICSLSTLMGVVVITKPQTLFDMDHLNIQTFVGVGLALGCTLLSTISFITLRWLRRIHYSLTLFSFGTYGTLENLVLALVLGVFSFPRGQTDWLLAGGLAVLTFFGQVAIIMALKSEQTGPVSLVRTCDVIFGYLFQIIASKSLPDCYSLLGASIVIVCLVFTGIRKWLTTLPEEHGTRKRFWYLLK